MKRFAEELGKHLSGVRLMLAIIIEFFIALLPACFERMQSLSPDGTQLELGFPYVFYTIKITAFKGFAVHFNIALFISNIIIIYILFTACMNLYKMIKL